MGHVHSPYTISDQLLFSLDLNQTLDSFQDDLLTKESQDVLFFPGLSSASHDKLGQVLIPGSYVVGNVYITTVDIGLLAKIEQLVGFCPRVASCFNQAYHQGTILTSIKYGRSDSKRDSTI